MEIEKYIVSCETISDLDRDEILDLPDFAPAGSGGSLRPRQSKSGREYQLL